MPYSNCSGSAKKLEFAEWSDDLVAGRGGTHPIGFFLHKL